MDFQQLSLSYTQARMRSKILNLFRLFPVRTRRQKLHYYVESVSVSAGETLLGWGGNSNLRLASIANLETRTKNLLIAMRCATRAPVCHEPGAPSFTSHSTLHGPRLWSTAVSVRTAQLRLAANKSTALFLLVSETYPHIQVGLISASISQSSNKILRTQIIRNAFL
jgi:hypothetical protein